MLHPLGIRTTSAAKFDTPHHRLTGGTAPFTARTIAATTATVAAWCTTVTNGFSTLVCKKKRARAARFAAGITSTATQRLGPVLSFSNSLVSTWHFDVDGKISREDAAKCEDCEDYGAGDGNEENCRWR